ncbi:MAG TPA: MBL fold metallo-hydrolase [Alphaproteobacteria bacterium]|nr:MBL fold metallo-hydrolase [Alphaproteobacteria bacterium]
MAHGRTAGWRRGVPDDSAHPHPIAALVAALIAGLLLLLLPRFAVGACLPVARGPSLFQLAVDDAAPRPPPGNVALTFLGHASFLIETAAGVTAVTDYNGVIRPPVLPDIVTMNNAHPLHYTDDPDPGIKYVLRGWDPDGGLPRHNIVYKDLRVRNVPTNLRDEAGGTRFNGNSIFVFEAANLCIAHLGHLHHTLTDVHLGELGQIDVLLAPVDGAYTMSQAEMAAVVAEIAAPLVIPMHYFSQETLDRFLTRMKSTHDVVVSPRATVLVSRDSLPRGRPEVLVLPGS